jgi:single-strand DNA-binding protein
MATPDTPVEATAETTINLSVLRGACSAPPEVRELPSGRFVATVSVRVPGSDGRGTSVPVTVWDPPAWLEALGEADEVVVVGRVRRRFFRTAAGGVGARVDVEAEAVARTRDRRRLAALRRRVAAHLEALDGGD